MALRDINGELLTIKDVGSGAPIEFYKTQKLQQMKLYICWNKIPAIYCRPHELNLELDTLDKNLKFVEVGKNYRTIVSVAKICNGYFVRKSKDDKLLIVDEAHRFSDRPEELKSDFKYMLGLSATPFSGTSAQKGMELMEFFGGQVFNLPIEVALERGFLVPYYYHPIYVYATEDEEGKFRYHTQLL